MGYLSKTACFSIYERSFVSSQEFVSSAVLERTSASMPRFITLPRSLVEAWNISGFTLVEGSVNGFELGRVRVRTEGADCAIEVPSSLCAKAQVNTGDTVQLCLRTAAVSIPQELQLLLDTDPIAQEKWVALSDSERRRLQEHVTVARLADTRVQRARDGLSLGKPPATHTNAAKPTPA